MASATVGLGRGRGAEEGAVEIKNEELARQLGERFGTRRCDFKVGGQIRNECETCGWADFETLSGTRGSVFTS